jgi:hypothetical protein
MLLLLLLLLLKRDRPSMNVRPPTAASLTDSSVSYGLDRTINRNQFCCCRAEFI